MSRKKQTASASSDELKRQPVDRGVYEQQITLNRGKDLLAIDSLGGVVAFISLRAGIDSRAWEIQLWQLLDELDPVDARTTGPALQLVR